MGKTLNCTFYLVKVAPDDFTVICNTDLQNAAKTIGEGNKRFSSGIAPFLLVLKRLAFGFL